MGTKKKFSFFDARYIYCAHKNLEYEQHSVNAVYGSTNKNDDFLETQKLRFIFFWNCVYKQQENALSLLTFLECLREFYQMEPFHLKHKKRVS